MRAYQTAGRGGGVRENVVKWSGKNEFWSGKSQGISFQTKSGHPETAKMPQSLPSHLSNNISIIWSISYNFFVKFHVKYRGITK